MKRDGGPAGRTIPDYAYQTATVDKVADHTVHKTLLRAGSGKGNIPRDDLATHPYNDG